MHLQAKNIITKAHTSARGKKKNLNGTESECGEAEKDPAMKDSKDKKEIMKREKVQAQKETERVSDPMV